MSIHVFVTVGIGAWKAMESLRLVACPHVGDDIDVGGVTVHCEQVTIAATCVYVEETIHFESEQQAKEYFSAEEQHE